MSDRPTINVRIERHHIVCRRCHARALHNERMQFEFLSLHSDCAQAPLYPVGETTRPFGEVARG